MRRVVASDLDRTLIWSAAAAGDVHDALCVEEYDDAPLSYVSARAAEHLEVLLAGGLLVPVTTRTVAQYRRVRLPGGPARFAVCANGGRLLVDGVEDESHRDVVREAVAVSASLEEATRALAGWCASVSGADDDGGPRLREAEGLFCYAVYPRAAPAVAEVEVLATLAGDLGWRVSVQGRKVYCVPVALSKESALEHLAAAHDLEVVATAGDSLLDAGMLQAHAAGWVPRDAELVARGWELPGVVRTAGVGLAAGEEIAAAFRAILGV